MGAGETVLTKAVTEKRAALIEASAEPSPDLMDEVRPHCCPRRADSRRRRTRSRNEMTVTTTYQRVTRYEEAASE